MHGIPGPKMAYRPRVAVVSKVRNLRARLHLATDGQSAVELALCLPLLLLVVTGIMVFGIAFNNYITLTHAASVGARQLAISRGQTTDPCATVASAVYSAAPLLKPSSIVFTYVLNGTSYSGTSCNSGSTTTGAAGDLVLNTSAQVFLTYPCSLAVYGKNYAPSCHLQARTTEIVQ
jgi:Flp pilus assembly protein TadG